MAQFVKFGSGWNSKTKEGIINAVNDPGRTGIKIKIVDCESGNEAEVTKILVKAVEKKPGMKGNPPDFEFSFIIDD